MRGVPFRADTARIDLTNLAVDGRELLSQARRAGERRLHPACRAAIETPGPGRQGRDRERLRGHPTARVCSGSCI